jgi:hypothetical protein
MKEKPHIMSLLRDETHNIYQVSSNHNWFNSERNNARTVEAMIKMNIDPDGLPTCWEEKKKMIAVPLRPSNDLMQKIRWGKEYELLPEEFRSILERDLIRTAPLGTRSDYSVLMASSTSSLYPEGRTGVLLHKNEPVIINIDGKDFLVEIKGVGSPDGNNRKKEPMIREGFCGENVERYGGFTERTALREFNNLELLRDTPTFEEGDCPRAAILITYLNDVAYGEQDQRQNQGYLIRLTPSNVRASFNGNAAFPKHDHMKLAESVARHYVELMRKGLYHVSIHPENILYTGTRYVWTDLADAWSMDKIPDSEKLLNAILPTIEEVPGITEAAVKRFYEVIKEELDIAIVD